MAVTFTSARELLAIQAATLSVEATRAGLSALATALTNLSTEITNNSLITESEFFGGGSTNFSATGGTGGTTPSGGSASGSGSDKDSAAVAWSNMLSSAASVISAYNMNSLRDSFVPVDSTKFWENVSGIATDVNRLATNSDGMLVAVSDMKERATGEGLHIVGPWEWLGMSSIVKLYEEKGIDLTELKAKVDAVPKSI